MAAKSWTYAKLGATFGESFSASLSEDLLAFLVLGIAGALIPAVVINSPEEEPFGNRVHALINRPAIYKQPDVMSFLLDYLPTILGFNRQITLSANIAEYNLDAHAYRITCELKYILVNMCNDTDYIPHDPTIAIFPDVPVNGSKGYFSYLGTFDPLTDTLHEPMFDGHLEIEEDYTRKMDLNIPKDSELGWMMNFTIWNKIADKALNESWYYNTVDKYTQKINIHIKNDLAKPIIFEIRYFNQQNNFRRPIVETTDLLPGRGKKYSPNIKLNPKDRIEIYIENKN